MGNAQSNPDSAPEADGDALIDSASQQHPPRPSTDEPPFEPAHHNTRSRRQRFSLYASLRRTSQQHPAARSNLSLQALNQNIELELEARPLVDAERSTSSSMDLTPTNILSNPLARSASSVSRLGSRFLPNTVARVLLSSGEETSAEGHALRNGAPERWRTSQRQAAANNQRFSFTDSIRRRIEQRSDPQTETRRHAQRGAFPANATHQQLYNETDTAQDIQQRDSTQLRVSELSAAVRRRGRLRRVRASLSNPVTNLFSPPLRRHESMSSARVGAATPSRVAFAEDSDHLLPPLNTTNPGLDMDDPPHELDAVESEARPPFSRSASSAGMNAIRRLPASFRSRSRLYRRQENPPLSQVLQLAAQAIATQLSTHNAGAVPATRPVVGDTFGGSIEDFVHTLQEAASAQAGENLDVNTPEGELPPVNFMRVFQFPNDENGQPLGPNANRNGDAMRVEHQTLPSDPDRSVTLVLVGVRSMPPTHEALGDGAIGPSLDNILNLPNLAPTGGFGSANPGAILRRAGRARARPRQHPLTNFDFPAQYESQRHHRPRMSSLGQSNDPLTTVSPISESPPGPHPPPSTPADIRSGQATPIRRPSSASAAHTAALPDLDENRPQSASAPNAQPDYTAARQRIRSDSEFARRPELGAGAVRRNGVVEPDHVHTTTGRSWLIYVVGTNVSPNHPAFTMPSLFTDNPSYEDMQMLTTLLGPVKPPVASREDVGSSGGLYRLTSWEGGLLAESLMNDQHSPPERRHGERCLICLCDYEAEDEVRQLNKCQHVYHRECIDEWLTTGRNNCPMCRGQGVEERNPSAPSAEDAATSPDAAISNNVGDVEAF